MPSARRCKGGGMTVLVLFDAPVGLTVSVFPNGVYLS